MKQIKIFADFHVGNDIDADLLLEIIQAAIGDVFYDKSKEWMIANLGDIVDNRSVDFLNSPDEIYIPCGIVLGHGESCVEGHLCGNCERFRQLEV